MKMSEIKIRKMCQQDVKNLNEMFLKQGWEDRTVILQKYLIEQANKKRWVFVATADKKVMGYVTLISLAKNGPYKEKYPEIVDFNVFEVFQKHGIGTKLLDKAETVAKTLDNIVTLGVGLHQGYGAAQRLYIKRGYIPDGSGIWFNDKKLALNEPCLNNNELVLYLAKKL